MYLVQQVLDKEIDDKDGHKAGKVNDLILELPDDGPPRVTAILTGPDSFVSLLPDWMDKLTLWIRTSILGLKRVDPHEIDWQHVTHIDVAVHVDLDRVEAGLVETQEHVWKRWLEPLPFSRR